MDERLQGKPFRLFLKRVEELKSARSEYLHSFLGDPFARFLIRTLRFSVWRGYLFGLAMVLWTYSLRLAVFYSVHGNIGIIQRTHIDWIYDLILVPATYGYYIWISTRLPYSYFRLIQNGVIENTKEEEPRPPNLHRHCLNRPAVFFGALSFMLILFGIHLIQFQRGPWIWSSHSSDRIILFVFKIPFTWLIPWYMVFVIFIKQILYVFHLRKMYQLPGFHINFFHPDHCGGLKVLSDYLLQFTYYLMLCAFGIALLITRGIRFGYFRRDFLVQGAMILYIPLCLFFFYFPLLALNQRLKSMAAEFRERIREFAFIPRWTFTSGAHRRFMLVLFSPFVFFVLIELLIK